MSPLYLPPYTNGTIEPGDAGYKAWSFDVPSIGAATAATGGTLNLVRLFNRRPVTISSVTVYVGTAGAALTNVGFTLYTQAGSLLTSSVNANGATAVAFQSTGSKVVTFTPQTIVLPSFYFGWWTTGTTQPALQRGGQTVALVMNMGFAAPLLRFATTTDTALTTTAPATFGTQSPGLAYWCAAA